jgi:hypothetical protein
MAFTGFPDTSNDMISFWRQTCQEREERYGRVQAGSGEAGQEVRSLGDAHCAGPRHRAVEDCRGNFRRL